MESYYDIYVVLKVDGQDTEEYYDGGLESIEECKIAIQRWQSNEYKIYRVVRTKELADTVNHFKDDVQEEHPLADIIRKTYHSDDTD